MNVLVTGATGFIGGHLARELTRSGRRVRCLFRKSEHASLISSWGCEPFPGDLASRDSLEHAVRGMDEVYHLGAIARHDAGRPESDYRQVNLEGTRLLLEASRKASVGQFIYMSSIEAVGPSRDGKPLTEASPLIPRNVYGRSKMEAENACRQFCLSTGFPVKIVRPPAVYGPGELLVLQRMFRPVSKGFFILLGSGDALMEFCYIKNLLQGIKLVAEKGRPAEAYFLSDERPYMFREVVLEMAKQMEKKIFLLKVPAPAALALAVFFEAASKVLRFYPFYIKATGRPPISRETLSWTLKSTMFLDISKAKRELGFTPEYSLVDGLKETVEWYRSAGLL
jgi:nucleoside-diphosphate-sugar epimerase